MAAALIGLNEFEDLTMKSATAVGLLLTLPLAAIAQPSVVQDSIDYARVTAVSPIPGPEVARQICRQVSVERPAENNAVGAVLGGLGGALIGSRFGKGHGREAMTVAGAIGGAVVGDRYASGGWVQGSREQCETVYEPSRPTGYHVTYEYRGQRQTVTMNRDPGDTVRLRKVVTVE